MHFVAIACLLVKARFRLFAGPSSLSSFGDSELPMPMTHPTITLRDRILYKMLLNAAPLASSLRASLLTKQSPVRIPHPQPSNSSLALFPQLSKWLSGASKVRSIMTRYEMHSHSGPKLQPSSCSHSSLPRASSWSFSRVRFGLIGYHC